MKKFLRKELIMVNENLYWDLRDNPRFELVDRGIESRYYEEYYVYELFKLYYSSNICFSNSQTSLKSLCKYIYTLINFIH